MRVYFSARQLEELRGYPPGVRGMVVQRARVSLREERALVSWLPQMFSSIGCVLGVIGAGWLQWVIFPGQTIEERVASILFYYFVGFVVGGLTGGLAGLQLELRALRKHISKAIQDYGRLDGVASG